MGSARSLTAIVRGNLRSVIAALGVLVLAAELALFGGDRREVALIFVLLQTAGLALVLGFTRWAPAELRHRRGLAPFFLLAAALAAWTTAQFAPFGGGMAELGWTAVGAAPSITIDRFASLVELAKLAGLSAVFVFGFLIGTGERRASAGFAALGFVGALYAAWALGGYYAQGWGVVIKDSRLSASVLSPNTAAAVFGLFAAQGWTAALLAVRTVLSAGGERRAIVREGLVRAWPWLGLTLISLWALMLTGSRGGVLCALLGLAVVSLATALARERQPQKGLGEAVAIATGGLALLLVAALGAQAGLAARLGAYQNGLADRTAYLDLYAGHLRDVPWTGLGLGTFARFNPLMLGPQAPSRFWEFGAMHDVYLQWLYEGGLPGATLMFAIVLWAVGVLAWGLRRRGAGRRWAIAALGVSAMLATHGTVDYDLQIHAVAALWALVLGAGVGAALRRG